DPGQVFFDEVRFGGRRRVGAGDVGRLGAGGPAEAFGEVFARPGDVFDRGLGVEVDEERVADRPARERPAFGGEGHHFEARATSVGAGDVMERGAAVGGVEATLLV